MPIYELASNLVVTVSNTYYLGPLNTAGYNAVFVQVTPLGTIAGVITVTFELSVDQANWYPSGVTGLLPTTGAPVFQTYDSMGAYVRIKVTSNSSGTGNLAVTCNTYNK